MSPYSHSHALIHFDGDAFFVSVEQSMHPELKGRPVVTGKERGIVSCAGYEAKALGVSRSTPLREAIRRCPGLVVLPSDYETYSLYSKRMFDIARRHTPMVEEYSIDEGFADLTGLRRLFHASYEEIARRIQSEIRAELDITVSVGLAPTKCLAKLASKFRKPRGFTAVDGPDIPDFLAQHPLEKVWGFGPSTVALLTKLGLRTARDFIERPEAWAERVMGKIGREIWNELRGNTQYPVSTEEKSTYYSLSKCKTFSSPSSDPNFIWAKLVRNVESALIKARRHQLRPRVVAVMLRQKDYRQTGLEAPLDRATTSPQELLPMVRALFDRLFLPGTAYRSTLVVLGKLESDTCRQYELFEDRTRSDKLERLAGAADAINARYGKHKLSLGPSLFLDRRLPNARDEAPQRKTDLLPGETTRRHLRIPRVFLPV